MINNKAASTDKASASIEKGVEVGSKTYAHGTFIVECFDKDGNKKWDSKAPNLVVTEGAQYMNDTFFDGVSYSAAWYLGLIQGPTSATITGADTLASKAWTEVTGYTGNRKAVTFGSATNADPSVINNNASPSQFIMNTSTNVVGAFLTTVATGTSGVLFSASNFQAPGNRAVVSGDTLNVTYVFSLDQTP